MTTVNGIPAHILLVHAIVVLLPLSSGLLVLTAAWPRASRHLAGPNALLSLGVLALVPIATDAGEWLERRVPESALLRDHTDLGDAAVWVAIPVAVMALIIWWRNRETMTAETATRTLTEPGGEPSGGGVATATRTLMPQRTYLAPHLRKVSTAVAALAVVVAGVAVYDIYRIGDSGSRAAWHGQFSTTLRDGGPRRPHD